MMRLHAALAAFVLSQTWAQDASNAAAAREWNQPRGNAAGTAAIAVEPLETAPVEQWRKSFRSVVCEPVTWAGVVYVVAEEKRDRRLLAFRVEDGEPVGSVLTTGDGPVWLATWQGTVALVEERGITFFNQTGKQLKKRESVKTGSTIAPCLYAGWLLVGGESGLNLVEVRSGKSVAWSEGTPFRAAVVAGSNAGEATIALARYEERAGYAGKHLVLVEGLVSGIGSKLPAIGLGKRIFSGSVYEHGLPLFRGLVARLDPTSTNAGAWFVFSPLPVHAERGAPVYGALLPDNLAPILHEPATAEGVLYGFSAANQLIAVRANGSFAELIDDAEKLPAGARPGPASMAGSVLYLSNWAVDTEDGRVLWCIDGVEAESPVVPAADRCIVLATTAEQLVCFGESAAPPALAEPAPALTAPSRPGTGEGVVLANGRRVAGTIEEAGAELVRVKSDPPAEFRSEEVALVESADGAHLRGEEYPVFLAWWDALRLEHLLRLESTFESYRKGGHVADCQRLLESARELDGPPALLEGWNRRLAGKAQSTSANAAQQRARIERDELKERDAFADELESAARWCRENGLGLAASVLLSRSDRVLPGRAELLDLARALAPPGFPATSSANAGERWLRFSEALLPAGARLVPPEDALWERVRGSAWEEGTICLRTANLVLFTKERDPEVLGPSLGRGEGVLRTLAEFFPASEGVRAPLEVRLHSDRDAYLAETTASGALASPWSAGYFSPSERISRFFVPRGPTGEPLGRGLYEVLTHELVHQHLALRWMDGEQSGDPEKPGFWVVEGVARFFEDQIVDLRRRERSLDDRTVSSIDACAAVLAKRKLIPITRLLELDQNAFWDLNDEPIAEIELRHTLAYSTLSERAIFYEEAGSLFFFLFHRDEATRQRLIDYLRAWHHGTLKEKSWEALGFEGAQALETEFHAFLRDAGG